MSAADIQIFIGSVTGLLMVLAGGAKWLLSHIDARQVKAELAEAKARNELSDRLHEEIRVLRSEVASMQAEKGLYLRRIFQLERFIHAQPGINIPEMEGWPPV